MTTRKLAQVGGFKVDDLATFIGPVYWECSLRKTHRILTFFMLPYKHIIIKIKRVPYLLAKLP